MLRNKKILFPNDWQRINMRNVAHLLGVEFIHDLYNRHLPRINSIRFRNTITIWRNGVVNSFAPREEWDALVRWFGEKFIRLDPIVIREIKRLINTKSIFLDNFLKKFPVDLTKINNIDLGFLLLNLHYFVLGELYRVNLIQIEHAVTFALLKLLEKYEKEENKRTEILSYIINSNKLTEFQKERQKFFRIVRKGQKIRVKNPLRNKIIYRLLYRHFKNYSYLRCAYGELPKTFKEYVKEYIELFPQDIQKFDIVKNIKEKYKKGKGLLRKLKDKKVTLLANIMSKIGMFRDKNKAKLGQTIRYRLMILNEIARRKLEKRDNLDYYLLSEILELLYSRKRVSQKLIKIRKTQGVTLYRWEYLENGVPSWFSKTKASSEKEYLEGICASPGVVIGKCRVVTSKKDIPKIKNDEILVAIGTDFNLLEGVLRAKGVITEEGGILSHASVVCREMGKPCCIGVKGATKILKNKKIKLDASNGRIYIYKK